ncbi:hypothetical protein D9M68_976390 [compost metagenome]
MIGPSFSAEAVPAVIERLVQTFVEHREADERFVETVNRIGLGPFRERVYAAAETTL